MAPEPDVRQSTPLANPDLEPDPEPDPDHETEPDPDHKPEDQDRATARDPRTEAEAEAPHGVAGCGAAVTDAVVTAPPPVAGSSIEAVPDTAETAAETPVAGRNEPQLAQVVEQRLVAVRGRHVARRLPRPSSTRVFVVANQKGGVGKTTSAVNIAAALAQHGQRVLVLDLDPQGNASTALSIGHDEGTPSAYEVLVGGKPIDDVVVSCGDVAGLDAVPATIDLAGAEIELVSMVARETRLARALSEFLAATADQGDRYDYVFIDCPPSLGLLTVNALTAARELLIPIQCEYYALEGLGQLLRTIEQVKRHLNPGLGLGAILLTMFDGRTRLAAAVADDVRQHFGAHVLTTPIPRSVRISEAPSYGKTVISYDPGSTGALAYLDAAAELAGARILDDSLAGR